MKEWLGGKVVKEGQDHLILSSMAVLWSCVPTLHSMTQSSDSPMFHLIQSFRSSAKLPSPVGQTRYMIDHHDNRTNETGGRRPVIDGERRGKHVGAQLYPL